MDPLNNQSEGVGADYLAVPAPLPALSGRPTFRLVASDWDRTLAPPPGTHLEPRTARRLSELKDRGAHFVLASGRPTPGVLNLAIRNGVDPRGVYVIGFNGGSVSSAARPGEYLWSVALAPLVIEVTEDFARRHGMEFLVPTPKAVFTSHPDGYFTQVEAQSAQIGTAPLGHWSAEVVPALKAEVITTGFDDDRVIEELGAELAAAGTQVRLEMSAPGQLELNAPGANKGEALKFLCSHLGIPTEEVVAFGDNHNDLSLLAAAGLGCAVENAVPELLAAADQVIGSCEDQGVAAKLEELFSLG